MTAYGMLISDWSSYVFSSDRLDDCGRCLRLAAGTDCRGAFRRDAERGGSMGVDALFQRLLASRLVVRCGGSRYILYRAWQAAIGSGRNFRLTLPHTAPPSRVRT